MRARRWTAGRISAADPAPPLDDADRELLERYVDAFERYDIDALTSLIQRGRDAVDAAVRPLADRARRHLHVVVWARASAAPARGSSRPRRPTAAPAFGQYKPSETGDGFDPWALQVLELSGGLIAELTFFLDTDTLFPLFGLPDHLEA